jgi:hypothetical protein
MIADIHDGVEAGLGRLAAPGPGRRVTSDLVALAMRTYGLLTGRIAIPLTTDCTRMYL